MYYRKIRALGSGLSELCLFVILTIKYVFCLITSIFLSDFDDIYTKLDPSCKAGVIEK